MRYTSNAYQVNISILEILMPYLLTYYKARQNVNWMVFGFVNTFEMKDKNPVTTKVTWKE